MKILDKASPDRPDIETTGLSRLDNVNIFYIYIGISDKTKLSVCFYFTIYMAHELHVFQIPFHTEPMHHSFH